MTVAQRNPGAGSYAPRIVVCRDAPAVFRQAARCFADAARQSIAARGRFFAALSGGSTPRGLYELLATPEWSRQVDWTRGLVFWGDERFVPPASSQSNYGMASAALLSRVNIPPDNIFPVPTEAGSAEEAAAAYERTLRRALQPPAGSVPVFDLVLLGLGTNGHTASLFPHTKVLHEADRLVAAEYVEEVESFRITMTARLLNRARILMFLVTGGEKASVLNEVLFGGFDPDRLPAQLVRPDSGDVTWIVDQSAAALLPPSAMKADG